MRVCSAYILDEGVQIPWTARYGNGHANWYGDVTAELEDLYERHAVAVISPAREVLACMPCPTCPCRNTSHNDKWASDQALNSECAWPMRMHAQQSMQMHIRTSSAPHFICPIFALTCCCDAAAENCQVAACLLSGEAGEFASCMHVGTSTSLLILGRACHLSFVTLRSPISSTRKKCVMLCPAIA